MLAGRSEGELAAVAAEIAAGGGEACVARTDVTDADSTRSLAVRALDAFGQVDVLVANSGVAGPTAPLWEVAVEDWEQTQAVNVRGVFLSCRALVPHMLDRGSGSIVVVGSMSGKRPLVHRSPYTTSKMALVGLVRTLAAEVGPYGLRVNLVSPGPVDGPRLDAVLAGQARQGGRTVEERRAEYVEESPLRRIVQPDDVADAIVFLAGAGSAAVTGEDLNVSVGITMH
ncbi:MAG: family oxidoreductase [Frankiales bacterium]|nr:family oxidoreductase [Frankiales bacterium]